MSDNDWDEPVTTQPVPTQGRMFGMRGRGFRPVEDIVGLPRRNYKSENKENSSSMCHNNFERKGVNKKNIEMKKRTDGADDDKNDQNPCGKNGNNNNNNYYYGNSSNAPKGRSDSKNEKEPVSSKYIPKEIEDEELFAGGIRTGINFDKYDDFDVKVSGENIPNKIENFESAGLHPLLYSNIAKCAYKKPTPIQKYALPIIMNGRDMMACAQTGSGKTAAFLLPILSNMLEMELLPTGDGKSASPQFIVISPTRELAIQIYVETKKFTYGSKLKTEIAYGGTYLRYQIDRIKGGCNIIIGTPGRLKDFIRRKILCLHEIRHIVIDEADEMLDNNFLGDIEDFLTHPLLNKENIQILMFSATFPEKIQSTASKFLKNYLFLGVGIVGGACADVEQKFYLVSKYEKRPKLMELLERYGAGKTVVFVSQKRTADIIAAFLSEKDYPATSIHGGREQLLREEALNDFRSGKMDLLVATAVAARGLDIKNVSHVINFDLPKSIDEYVHRIGRTGRVGNRGLASSFYCPDENAALAPALVRTLVQTNQEVPEFLQTTEACNSWSRLSLDFGGKDIRRRGGFRGHDSKDGPTPLETCPTYEEEVW